MRLIKYSFDELKFAFIHHVYVRCQSHYRRSSAALAALDRTALAPLLEPLGVHLLQCETGPTEVRLLISLQPGEAVASGVSKTKGQIAKLIRQSMGDRLARGYFACTSGKSKADEIDAYLTSQSEHHGYATRPRQPVFVKTLEPAAIDEARLASPHAKTMLRYHVVFSTWKRRGVFREESGEAVSAAWKSLEETERFSLLKVSFVPDHVHLAVRVHPSVAPGKLVCALMNSAQEIVWRHFAADAIQARAERLFQPSAYLGSFGDLATPQIEAYLRNWCAETA